jgi:hypothetical protein
MISTLRAVLAVPFIVVLWLAVASILLVVKVAERCKR